MLISKTFSHEFAHLRRSNPADPPLPPRHSIYLVGVVVTITWYGDVTPRVRWCGEGHVRCADHQWHSLRNVNTGVRDTERSVNSTRHVCPVPVQCGAGAAGAGPALYRH